MRLAARLLVVLAALLAPLQALATVAFDATSSAMATTAGATSLNLTTLTVGAGGSNRALVAFVIFSAAPGTVTVKWDNAGTPQTMTQIVTFTGATGASGNGEIARLYGLIAPTTGNKTLNVATTNSVGITLDAASFTGVDQTSVAVAFPNTNTLNTTGNGAGGNFTTSNLTITSAVGDAVVSAWATGGSFASTFTNQTRLHSDNTNASGMSVRAAGAATVNTNAIINSSASVDYVGVGSDILAAAAAGGCTKTLMLMGAGC